MSSSKRSRSSLGRYDDSSDERLTPPAHHESDLNSNSKEGGGGGGGGGRRGSRGRSPGAAAGGGDRERSGGGGRHSSGSPRGRGNNSLGYGESHRGADDYRGAPRGGGGSSTGGGAMAGNNSDSRAYGGYKVLCVSSLHPKASDEAVRETLYREFKKYGDISVKVVHEPDERVAYVYFRSYEDARDAKHSKPRVVLFDKAAVVEAAYESVARTAVAAAAAAASDMYRTRRSASPEYDRYYRGRSPGATERRHDDRYYAQQAGARSDFRRDTAGQADLFRSGSVATAAHHVPAAVYAAGTHRAYKHFDKHENKKDKFPNYLHHVPPEDDPLATRTLFAGNLEINISEEELRRIFGRYGIVEDIDIKRPPPGTGNAYAFVRFQNLDQAHRSKVELSGQYIGKFQCKIGFGKVTPTTRIWVGGLGPWMSLPQLEREFDRFGAIKKIDYVKGDNHAYILYDSIDAAQAAVKEMRGFPLGGPDRRLRIDFADVTPTYPYKGRPFDDVAAAAVAAAAAAVAAGDYRGRRDDFPGYDRVYEWDTDYAYAAAVSGGYRGSRGGSTTWRASTAPAQNRRFRGEYEDWAGKRGADGEPDGAPPRQVRRSRSPDPTNSSPRRSPSRRHSAESETSEKYDRRNGALTSARTLVDVARKSDVAWQGALILKNSLFPTKLHLTDGDHDVVESLLRDEEGKPLLRITQRLRLDPPKLEDVSKRISGSTSHAIFLSLPGSSSSVPSDDANVQARPLRNLVSYLKQKEAAGVISLQNKESEATGVLYAFPPCQFSAELLQRTAPGLTEEGMKEDHLVIVVVRGGSA